MNQPWVLSALAILMVAEVWRRGRRRTAGKRLAVLEAGLGPTIDLILVVLGSGGTIRDGIATVAECGPAPVKVVALEVLQRSDSGVLLADALLSASAELGPAYHPLIGALVATERDGAPISLLLQRLADEADQARRWRSEAMARQLPVALLLPLVVCLLPAVVVGAIVPLAIVALRQLGI